MQYVSLKTWLAIVLCFAAHVAHAQLAVVVAVEPSARTAAQTVSRSAMERGLSEAAGQPVVVSTSDDLAGMMRVTRSAGFNIFIGPPQIATSALQRGYELVGATSASIKYVLVTRKDVADLPAMKGRLLYLAQQDSIYSYMARGMLNSAGLSFQDLKAVNYGKFPEAGLAALTLGSADATVVSEGAWKEWSAQHPDQIKLLATSDPVPGGQSIVVSRTLPPELRGKIAKWFAAPSASSGLDAVSFRPDAAQYSRVAELGIFTPTSLPQVQVATAQEVRKLQAAGAVVIDTRTDKEFKAKRIAGAVHAAYTEISIKDVAFRATQDDFSALGRLPGLSLDKPVIFACNGAECWKSYKAAKFAKANGYKNVYWFRGGLPEWIAKGLPTQGN